jgi:hypothetical protein
MLSISRCFFFPPLVGILDLIMTERKGNTLERMAPSTVKSEMLTHEVSIVEEGQLGLQPVPHAYPQQVGHLPQMSAALHINSNYSLIRIYE